MNSMLGEVVGTFIVMLLGTCALFQQSWSGSATIELKDGRTARCPDHFVSTPAAVACYTDVNAGKNIFTIPKSDINRISIGS